MVQSVDIRPALDRVSERWSPRVVDQSVEVGKPRGQLVWHRLDDEDEMFQTLHGRLRIRYEAGVEPVLEGGQFCIVPCGTTHNPVVDVEAPRTRPIAERSA